MKGLIIIMKENYLEKLEFNKITETLSTFCSTYLGKDLALKLIPSKNIDTAKNMLNETKEAISILYKCGNLNISEISDITEYIKILESYSILSIKGILDVVNIFKISQDLKKYFYAEYVQIEDHPILNSYFSKLYTNNSIIETVSKSIIDENTIAKNKGP